VIRARAAEVVETLHGVEVSDPYRWLEDGDDPEVRDWARGQDAHARAVLADLPCRPAVAARIGQAMDVGELGRSKRRGRYRFFTRRYPGMDRAVLAVSEAGGPPRTLVDPGLLSPDGAGALNWWEPSPDGELVCAGISDSADENSILRLVRTATGEWLPDRITRCPWSAVAFEPGNGAILYVRQPEPGSVPPGEQAYHRHVWRHVLGTDARADTRVFGEGRDRLDMPSLLSISPDGRWTVVTVAQGSDRTAVFLADGPGEFRPFFEGRREKLWAEFAGPRLIGLTNAGAPRFRLVEIDPERPEPAAWRDLVPESRHTLVDAVVTADRIAVHHLVDACSLVSLLRQDGTFERTLELLPFCTVTGLGGHVSGRELFVTMESFVHPSVTRLAGGGEVDRLEAPAGFDARRYPVRQVRYRSPDGTVVPMFLVGRPQGTGPTVLTGYGGFGVSRPPRWMPGAVPFLEAGGLLALPSLRGGGEFGEAWHRAGMRESKQRVFDDFIGAAEWLVASGLATPAQLGILGVSNGGLLVGAALTQRPDLFAAAVCQAPLLDMVRYERFKVARLWSVEFGSASDPEEFGWLHAYSPYHRVRDGRRYPATLLTTGEEDARVDPMHARKMAARLQAADPSGLTLLRVEPRGGHGPGQRVSLLAAEEADIWSFLLDRLGGPRASRSGGLQRGEPDAAGRNALRASE
jgi:prolyl oligopeptidase